MKAVFRVWPLFLLSLAYLLAPHCPLRIGSTRERTWATKIRLAAADFKPVGDDPQTPALKADFDSTLFNDLTNAGIFDMVSKSLAPQAMPGSPQEISLPQWSAAPANAAMVAFGALSAANGRLVVSGWLDDASNTAIPRSWASNTTKPPGRTWRAPLLTALPMTSSPGSAAASTESPKPRFISSAIAPGQKKSGRWTTTDRTSIRHPSGQHLHVAAHLTR